MEEADLQNCDEYSWIGNEIFNYSKTEVTNSEQIDGELSEDNFHLGVLN